MREVQVRAASSRDEGSCNGCTEYTGPGGCAAHRVWVVTARGSSLRFCDQCIQVLRAQLGWSIPR